VAAAIRLKPAAGKPAGETPTLRLIPLVARFLLGNADGWRSSGEPGGAQGAPKYFL